MLTELHLKNYILIPELKLNFMPGMTVITGETGAGKSILVGALNLIFGKASPKQVAYDEKNDVFLEITFQLSKSTTEVKKFLDEAGFPPENNEIVIAREISAAGKSISYLNGRKTNSQVLKDLHDLLIDFHHQRDQQNLLNTSYQLDLLDQYGELIPLRYKFQQQFKELQNNLQTLRFLQESDAQNQQLIDLYRFQADELKSAALQIGEDVELEAEYELLSHSEEIITLSAEQYSTLYEQENSVFDIITDAQHQLQKYMEMSPKIAEVCARLDNGIESVRDASSLLNGLKNSIASDPERLVSVQQRLDLINNLKSKYKQPSIQDLLAYLQKIENAINAQDNNSTAISELSAQIDVLFTELTQTADTLSDKRKKTARILAIDITKNVKQLSLPNAKLEIKIDKKTDEKILLTNITKCYSDTGQDIVEYRFSANPGSAVQPLKMIVSGGELSRILLAAKKSLSDVMPPRTIILDEIDIGIGGKTAGSLAEFIRKLAGSYQVFCITHLAKIAAAAENHILIDKKSQKDKTAVEAHLLDYEARVNEIARMLSGHITDLSIRHAIELLSIDKR